MQVSDWIDLMQRIPPEDMETFMLALNNGQEVAMQRLLQVNDRYALVRGRLGGTDDPDRVFCVPLEQVAFGYFNRPMPDRRVINIFGDIIGGIRTSATDAVVEAPKGEAAAPEDAKPAEAEADKAAAGPNVSMLRDRLLTQKKLAPGPQRPR